MKFKERDLNTVKNVLLICMEVYVYTANSCNIIHIIKVLIMLIYNELKKHEIFHSYSKHERMKETCCTTNNTNDRFLNTVTVSIQM